MVPVEDGPLNRRLIVLCSVGLLGLSLLGSLILMSAALQNSQKFGALYSILALSNSVGLLAFIALIGINVRRLSRQLRENRPGARLTLRMLIIFVVLAVVPVIVVYSFSLDFLRRGIDSWFDVRIERALSDALELGREALDLRMRALLGQTESMAAELIRGSTQATPLNLRALRSPGAIVSATTWVPGPSDIAIMRERSGAEELTLLTSEGELIASSSQAPDIIPHLLPETVLLQVRQGQSYIGLDPIRHGGLVVRVAVSVKDVAAGNWILHALYPVATRINKLAESVEYAYAKYNELAYLRERLKLSFAMTLTLVLMFSIVTAVWAAFYSARRIAAPIRDLADGTAAVAEGNYATSLPVESNDEVGFLVRSFNDMTRRIAQAREEVETQHKYLDTLLKQLSSGVVALDEHGAITTVNDAALKMLELNRNIEIGAQFTLLCAEQDHLAPLAQVLDSLIANKRDHWSQQITIFASDGRRDLMFRATALSDSQHAAYGYVIVFENVTAIIQGQRDAAWSEVARRLAHEIKNPLTPIQLSAERLRQKYLRSLEADEAEPMQRLTSTIIQQVETMKAMVNTFSDYAKPPVLNKDPVDINGLISGVVELFRSTTPMAELETGFEVDLPTITADASRLRQVFNNLMKNALEASPSDTNAHIIVTTSRTRYALADHVEIRVEDHGEGIAQEILDNIFEPYVTNKTRGTGLGLAIVKKIVEEHNGVVTLRNNDGKGASAVIRLPLDAEPAAPEQELHKDAV